MTLFIVENIDKDHRRKLFSILGTDYTVSNLGRFNPLLMIGIGVIVGLLIAPVDDTPTKLLIGVGYGVLIILCSLFHSLGHIISSRMAGAPMDAVILTLFVPTTHYEDDGKDITSRQHIMRALGGPLMNLALGLLFLLIYSVVIQCTFVAFFAGINLAFFVATISPIPSLDGAVILREMRR